MKKIAQVLKSSNAVLSPWKEAYRKNIPSFLFCLSLGVFFCGFFTQSFFGLCLPGLLGMALALGYSN